MNQIIFILILGFRFAVNVFLSGQKWLFDTATKQPLKAEFDQNCSLLLLEANGRDSRSDTPAEVKERSRSTASLPGSFTGRADAYILWNISIIRTNRKGF